MVGKKIKNLISNSDITQAYVAEQLNISIPTLRKIFNRESVEMEIVFALCKIFDVPVSYFFEELEGIEFSKTEKNEEPSDLLKENYSLAKRLADAENELKELYKKLFINRVDLDLGKDKTLLEENGFVIGARVVRMPIFETGNKSDNVKFGY